MSWVQMACGLALLTQTAWSAPVAADEDSNPYLTIVDRNPFRLSPPPPPPAPPEAPPPDLPTVIFSGTVTIGTETKAMFAIKPSAPRGGPRGAKPQEPEETKFISLKVNETEGPVQLLKINSGGDEVEIMNSGTKVTMNMKDNGYAKLGPAAAPPGPVMPGLRGLPGGPIMPAAQPGAQPQGSGGINLGSSGPPAAEGGIVTGGGANYAASGRGLGLSVGGNGTFQSGNAQANLGSALATLQNAAAGNTLSSVSGGVATAGAPRSMVATPITPNVPNIPSPIPSPGTPDLPHGFVYPNSTAPTPPDPNGIMPPIPSVGRGRSDQSQ